MQQRRKGQRSPGRKGQGIRGSVDKCKDDHQTHSSACSHGAPSITEKHGDRVSAARLRTSSIDNKKGF
jgi:hypothetical protein